MLLLTVGPVYKAPTYIPSQVQRPSDKTATPKREIDYVQQNKLIYGSPSSLTPKKHVNDELTLTKLPPVQFTPSPQKQGKVVGSPNVHNDKLTLRKSTRKSSDYEIDQDPNPFQTVYSIDFNTEKFNFNKDFNPSLARKEHFKRKSPLVAYAEAELFMHDLTPKRSGSLYTGPTVSNNISRKPSND